MDADSVSANVLEVLLPILGLLLIATPVVVSVLKKRWLGLIGAIVGVASAAVTFVVEPSAEFQETLIFWTIEKALNVGLIAGIGLVLFSMVRPARDGSWWSRRHRGIEG